MIAATFECVVAAETFIVQFNQPNMAGSAAKERFLASRLAAAGAPLRDLVCEGEISGLIYTIARKARGNGMTTLEPNEFAAVLPSVFDAQIAVSQVDLSDTDGYGWFDGNGHGHFDSWAEHLVHVRDEEPGLFYDRWHELFDSTFLERDRFDRYIARMQELLESFTVPRQLVHGGFGYDNVLVHEGNVEALLDWQDARFGDGLFDIAYMDFWPSGFDLPVLYEEYCAARGIRHHSFGQRIACYKYYHAADAMRFFAKTDNQSAYESVVELAERIEA